MGRSRASVVSNRNVARLALAATLVVSVGISRGFDAAMAVALLAVMEIDAHSTSVGAGSKCGTDVAPQRPARQCRPGAP